MTRRSVATTFFPSSSLTIPHRTAVHRAPLLTERLHLAPLDRHDADDLWDAIEGSRAHLQRWLPWVPFTETPEACDRFAEASAREWDAGRALRLSIRHRATRELLGIVGLDSCVHLHRSCDLGYWLRHTVTGQGLMTEAASAVVGYAFDRLNVHRLRCAAATDNHASQRVIRRLKFEFEGVARQAEHVDGRWLDHAVFARLAVDAGTTP